MCLAERKRLELLKRLSPLDGLAIRSNTIMGPLRITFGGSGEIRTHGTFRYAGFQDQSHRPLDHTSLYGATGRIRTYDFTGLQSVAFDHSATVALFGDPGRI